MNLEAESSQLALFVCYVAVGIVCAALYHMFCYPVNNFVKKRWIVNIVEAIVGAVLACAVWLFNIAFNDGQFRFFIVVAFFVGIALYLYICRSILDKLYKALYNHLVTKQKGEDNAQHISQ